MVFLIMGSVHTWSSYIIMFTLGSMTQATLVIDNISFYLGSSDVYEILWLSDNGITEGALLLKLAEAIDYLLTHLL